MFVFFSSIRFLSLASLLLSPDFYWSLWWQIKNALLPVFSVATCGCVIKFWFMSYKQKYGLSLQNTVALISSYFLLTSCRCTGLSYSSHLRSYSDPGKITMDDRDIVCILNISVLTL